MATQNALNINDAGIVAYDGAGTFSGRTLTAGSGVTITNGDGTGGNPTISASGSVPISFVTPSGTATPSAGVLNFLNGTAISFTGSGNNVTAAFVASGVPTMATSYTTDSGSAIPSLNVLTIAGGTGIDTSGAGSTVTVTFDVTEVPTIVTGVSTDSGAVTPSGNSVSIVGGTGIATSGSGSTTTISFVASGVPTIATSYVTDSGTATPALNVINIKGTSAQGVTTSGASATVTITNADWTTAQKGVGTLATNAETIAGTVTNKAVTPDDLKAKLGAQTNHAVAIFAGNSSALTLASPTATTGIPLVSNGSSSDPSFGTASVAGGGTGLTSFTTYTLLAGGTTSTGALQQVSGTGTSGQVLTSNGAGALPTWQAITVASKPQFIAKVTSAQNNVTGDGTGYDVLFTTVLINTSSGYDGTNTFTAPTTGTYMIGWDLSMSGVTTSHTYAGFTLNTTGTVIGANSPQVKITNLVNSTGTQVNQNYAGLFLMTAGDTIYLTLGISGGTKVVDVLSGKFWGYMVQAS